MLRAFFRQGKRDGRRGHPPEALRTFVTEAAELAASYHATAFLEEREEVLVRLAGSEVGPTDHGAQLPSGQVPVAAVAPPDGSPLAGSLVELQHRRQERRRAAERAEQARAASEERARAAAHAQDERRLAELPERCRSSVGSTFEAAQLLWTRYCAGFVAGAVRAKGDGTAAPSPALQLSMPEVLVPVPATGGE
jgi:hypothetical protein